jgi:hypothetical protein
MDRIKLRPHGHLFRQGFIAVLAFTTPVFVVLYVLTIPDGPWAAVLTTNIIATAIAAAAAASYFRVAIWVDRTGISEIGFLGGKQRVPIEEIGSIVDVDLYDGASDRAIPQLFVVGKDGRQLVRMRGQFWSRASMDIVAETLGVPHESLDDSLSTSELRQDYPGLLYWFERHPVVGALVFSLAVFVVATGVWLIFELAGR